MPQCWPGQGLFWSCNPRNPKAKVHNIKGMETSRQAQIKDRTAARARLTAATQLLLRTQTTLRRRQVERDMAQIGQMAGQRAHPGRARLPAKSRLPAVVATRFTPDRKAKCYEQVAKGKSVVARWSKMDWNTGLTNTDTRLIAAQSPAGQWMPLRCPICSIKFRQTRGIGSVTADGAYDTRKCHDATAARHAHAVIPPVRMPSSGRRTPRPRHEKKLSAAQSIWACVMA